MDSVDVYHATKIFPHDELYVLTSQLRRAALSAPSNIAEGAARSKRQFSNFLSNAIGSLNERDTQLELRYVLGMLPKLITVASTENSMNALRSLTGFESR
jgi:four helix bundle protein